MVLLILLFISHIVLLSWYGPLIISIFFSLPDNKITSTTYPAGGCIYQNLDRQLVMFLFI